MAKAKVSGSRSAGQASKKFQQVSKLLDQLIAVAGPVYPGFASVLSGARKLLLLPSPAQGRSMDKVTFQRRIV